MKQIPFVEEKHYPEALFRSFSMSTGHNDTVIAFTFTKIGESIADLNKFLCVMKFNAG